MRTELHFAAAAAWVLLASCATARTRTMPPRGRTQELMLRTDPAGATCAVLRDGAIVASVEATPGPAIVPRRNAPIDVVCRKEKHLEMRSRFDVASATAVEREEGLRQAITGGQITAGVGTTAGVGGTIAGVSAWSAGNLAALATATGVMTAGQTLMLIGAIADAVQNPPYAFRPVPEFPLIPATFDSAAAQDAFFAAHAARLEKATATHRAWIDEHCRPWPCKAADTGTCPSPYCEALRVPVSAENQAALDQIPALRARTRIVAP